ncbi:MAG: 4Fe-4S dicluster domain-containing protein [Gammaproteobacteria bacterium]|nr:4Fe-4S dicluster domain-containing protein [Gammaproteobacteria bacterium]
MSEEIHLVMESAQLQALLDALRARGFPTIGPTLRDGAIVYDEIESMDELPAGWSDRQEAGDYRLTRREDGALFGYNVGPHSWKRFLHPPALRLLEVESVDGNLTFRNGTPAAPTCAFIGVRACEVQAIAIQDRVFLGGEYADPDYRSRREGVFVVAVNCGQAGGTCFCASMDAGPKVTRGFDLSLTEIVQPGGHRFVVETGSERGAELMREIPHRDADDAEVETAERIVRRAERQMGRSMQTADLKELLCRNRDSPRWEEVASRCLSCANCTMVCPTCFCTTTEDVTDLDGARAERWRRWDSCFTLDFSWIHGGSVRTSAAARYRQWLIHKLATWIDQFGTSGCVGCGRCITWCPVGIDLTEEVAAIRASEAAARAEPAHARG